MSNCPVLRFLIPGSAGLLLLLPAAAVLVDSWVAPAAIVDPDGEGPQAPAPNPEVAEQRAKGSRIQFDLLAPPPRPSALLFKAVEPSAPAGDDRRRIAVRPKPVEPSGWLGRRHLRSPA